VRPEIGCPRCGAPMRYVASFAERDAASGKTCARSVWICECDEAELRGLARERAERRRAERAPLALRDWLVEELGFRWCAEHRQYAHRAGLSLSTSDFAKCAAADSSKFRSIVAEVVRETEERISEVAARDGEAVRPDADPRLLAPVRWYCSRDEDRKS